jgi:hypothetical protein
MAVTNATPINNLMNAGAASLPFKNDASELLLRHCLALGATGSERRSARDRLEDAVGPDLARRLLSSITLSGHR